MCQQSYEIGLIVFSSVLFWLCVNLEVLASVQYAMAWQINGPVRAYLEKSQFA